MKARRNWRKTTKRPVESGHLEPELEEIAGYLNPTERLEMASKLSRWAAQLVESVAVHVNSAPSSAPQVVAAQCLDLPACNPGLN